MGPWLWPDDPRPELDDWFFVRNDNRRKPFCGENNSRSSASVASGGKLPTYKVLHGGFWSAGLAGGGTRANNDKSGTSLADVLAVEVGVVAVAVAGVAADAEPDDEGPLRVFEGMDNGANVPLDWVGPCERMAATVWGC